MKRADRQERLRKLMTGAFNSEKQYTLTVKTHCSKEDESRSLSELKVKT